MTEPDQPAIAHLNSLSSEEAADWLIATFEDVPRIIAHRSWAKADKHRLMRFYFEGRAAFQELWPYETFLRVMSGGAFLDTMTRDILPTVDLMGLELLENQIRQVLPKGVWSKRDDESLEAFFEMIVHSQCVDGWLAAEVEDWPTKTKLAAILKEAGFSITVGKFSIRLNDQAGVFAFRGLGEFGPPEIDADSHQLPTLIQTSDQVSSAFAKHDLRHRFEIYDDTGTEVAYFHHHWPKGGAIQNG